MKTKINKKGGAAMIRKLMAACVKLTMVGVAGLVILYVVPAKAMAVFEFKETGGNVVYLHYFHVKNLM